ncbi:hypothetical protein OG21DRAFT_1503869 [Imleria badia]|nr:hypothetical protein OG21DRAFT_1503869 [Imleria badia]
MPNVFRAPSDSLASSDFTPTHAQVRSPRQPRPTQWTHAVQATKSKNPQRRARPHKLDKAKAAVQQAAKRVHKTKQLVEPCVAYVGNLGPDVDEDALIAHFSSYGNVLDSTIHCCGGVAMTVKPPPASYHQNMRVRQYGIVVFESKSARYMACKQENTLGGRKLIVSVAVSDLPEVKEKIVKRLDDYRSRLEPPDLRRAQMSALKSLKLDPTVLLDPGNGKERKLRKRFQFFDHSLQEGIM